MSTSCVPSFEEIALADGISAWAAAIEGWSEYATRSIGRDSPVDVFSDWTRWWRHMTDRRPPTWSSPNEVVFEAPVARLRDFSTTRSKKVVPTLVLPPQAGHDSCIVDYSPQQSQMGAIREAGLERAFTLDWIGATQRDQGRGHRFLPGRD